MFDEFFPIIYLLNTQLPARFYIIYIFYLIKLNPYQAAIILIKTASTRLFSKAV